MNERLDGRRSGGSAVFAPVAEGGLSMSGLLPNDDVPSGRFGRRRALKWVIGIGSLAFGVAFVIPATALRSLSLRSQSLADGEPLIYAATSTGAPVGEPLRADQLAVGTGVQVYPQGTQSDQNTLVEVVRIAEGDEGLLAYSAICTHLGCAVYANLSPEGLIACPCHNSQFDPANDAAVVGGPAGRPLPSLPIRVDGGGNVVVGGVFSGPIGIA